AVQDPRRIGVYALEHRDTYRDRRLQCLAGRQIWGHDEGELHKLGRIFYVEDLHVSGTYGEQPGRDEDFIPRVANGIDAERLEVLERKGEIARGEVLKD